MKFTEKLAELVVFGLDNEENLSIYRRNKDFSVMKLVKKISYERAKELPEFSKILIKFKEKLISHGSPKKKIFKSLKDLRYLNFYLIIEYVNISDIVDYNRIFPEDDDILDYSILIEEQKKLFDYINRKNKNNPDIFQKLGALNEVTGCFLLATNRKNINNVTIKNSKDTFISRFDKRNLPKEFNEICNKFYKEKQKIVLKEQEEFDNFLKLSFEEQNEVLQDILKSVQIPPIILMSNPIMNNLNNPETDKNNSHNNERGVVRLEDVAANHVDNIDSLEFLKGMLKSALETENYELCAKIRDRVITLTGEKPDFSKN